MIQETGVWALEENLLKLSTQATKPTGSELALNTILKGFIGTPMSEKHWSYTRQWFLHS